MLIGVCEACGENKDPRIHVGMEVTVTDSTSIRRKNAQFWVCESCAGRLSELLANDGGKRQRVARAMTPASRREMWLARPVNAAVKGGA